MKRFSDLMSEFNKDRNFNEKLEEVMALEAWNRVVTDDIARNTSPKYIRNGVLHVKAKSPAWAQELSGFVPKLKELLNDYLGTDRVQEIKFSCEPFRNMVSSGEPAFRPELDDVIVREKEVEKAAETTSAIRDDALREQLTSLIIQSNKLSRWRATKGWTVCEQCGRQIPSGEKECRRCKLK